MPRPKGQTHKNRIKKMADQHQAMVLRASGHGYVSIAEQMKCSKAWAYKLVTQAMEQYRGQLRESVDELRAVEIARLDHMLINLSDAMTAGDIEAIRAGIRISHQRSALLGLYPQPQQRQRVDDPDVVPTLPSGVPAQATVVFYLPSNGRDEPAPAYPQPDVIEGESRVVNGNGNANGHGH